MTHTPDELARRAILLLEDPAILEAVNRMRLRYTADWENSKPEDATTRERAYASLRALTDLIATLRSLVDGPKVDAFNSRKQGEPSP